MNLLDRIDKLLVSWGVEAGTADALDHFIAFALVVLLALVADLVCRHVLLKAIARLVRKTKAKWDDVVFDHKVMVHLSRMVVPVVIYLLVPVAFADVHPGTVDFIQRICMVFIILTALSFISSFLKALYSVYSEHESMRDRPLKGLLQTALVLLWFVGGILILSVLLGRNPLTLLAGLGASAAVLMLVFKDSIMGLVSGVQLSANDMLKVGDWIKMPKYDADGIVTEVTLNTVKVRNWDNTVTTVPPYALISDSFQNWNAMRMSGGRRIKRAINIDMNSVCFCTPQMLQSFRQMDLLHDYWEQMDKETDGRELTNLGVFRAYLTAYLRSLPITNQELHCMVRHLQPTEHGIPVELYFFSTVKDWIPYEAIQADVFDHVLAIIPRFGLRVYQSPSGLDLERLYNRY